MLEVIRSTADEADKELRPKLTYLVETAKDRLVELGELTRDEAERIGAYLRRDVEDAAGYLAGSKRGDLLEWLRLDTDLVERSVLDAFTGLADETRLDFMALEQQAHPVRDYRAGEITGIGTLRCTACGHLIQFHAAAQIPPCPRCRGTVFTRA
jgi:hypothetical protein